MYCQYCGFLSYWRFTQRRFDMIRLLLCLTHKKSSLKYATREARRQAQAPKEYLIHDDTRIQHIIMELLLSRDKSKADLAGYLAMRVLLFNKDLSKLVIAFASGHTRRNNNHLLLKKAIIKKQTRF